MLVLFCRNIYTLFTEGHACNLMRSRSFVQAGAGELLSTILQMPQYQYKDLEYSL